jgi:uncharacterized HAD superfamily protein/hypoxanthine phosphoribosyltransferase
VRFITIDDLNGCIYKHLDEIPDDIDLIVGIPRSGMLVANIIALLRNIPLTDKTSFIDGRIWESGLTKNTFGNISSVSEAKHILVVDDCVNTGEAMKKAKAQIKDSGYNGKITYLAVYSYISGIPFIDIFFEKTSYSAVYEWNYMHVWALAHTCMDIDGVLCADPSLKTLIGEKAYIDHIKDAKERIIPDNKVNCLITGRKEKYRQMTENWLKAHNVDYDNLLMLDEKNLGGGGQKIGEWKGNLYKSRKDCFLFIESSYEQAVEICKVSDKQVFCIENRRLITPENIAAHIGIIRRDAWIILKHTAWKALKIVSKRRNKDVV